MAEPVEDAVDLSDDPQLRALLAVARSWGVAPTVFLGAGQPAVTVHEYDAAGRVIRSTVTPRGWTDEDRQLAMALDDYEAGLCPGCRLPAADTMAAENEFRYRPTGPVMRCHACTARANALDQFRDSPVSDALYVNVGLAVPSP